jgi:serine/threonine protein kinase
LGAGGFADVFLFQQDMPRRQVAVKVLLKDFIDPDVLRLFNAEADIMAQLSAHPSILTVYDASVSADGRPYLVMEHCPDGYGRAFRKTPVSVGDALNIGVKMASALETAHRMGVLHRDVKPSNILKTSFGSPVLSDFGIATSLLGDSQNNVFAMSVPWSSPEVVSESTTGTVASEVWSLGATIYSLIAGRSPFEVDDSGANGRNDLKKRIEKAQYVSIPRKGIPVEVEHVLLKSMMKNPAQRQVSMLEFAMEHRKRIADQLPRIDSTMKYVTFGYRPRGSSEWTVVMTPEEREFPHIYYKNERKPRVDPIERLQAEFDDTPPF